MSVSTKSRVRKAAIDELLKFLLVKVGAAERGYLYRDHLLSLYSFESGLSIRLLREYINVLGAAGLIVVGHDYINPAIRLVTD